MINVHDNACRAGSSIELFTRTSGAETGTSNFDRKREEKDEKIFRFGSRKMPRKQRAVSGDGRRRDDVDTVTMAGTY